MEHIYEQLIYLCRCAVNEELPNRDLLEDMDLEKLYHCSKNQLLTAVTDYALESIGLSNDKFREDREKAIRKIVLLDVERQKLCSYLDKKGIWYMPLKGSILKDFYPKVGMRQMSDNDILFDERYRKDVRAYFVEQKYTVERYHKGNHDIYHKAPVLNFEMHVSLFSPHHWFQEYYKNVRERLVKDTQHLWGYHFTEEDFYVYMIAHEHKHYEKNGTGLRSLLDIYVYLKEKETSLHWDYIEQECEKLQIGDFEKRNRQLAQAVFGRKEGVFLSAEEERLLTEFVFAGTYGNIDFATKKKLQTSAYKESKFPKGKYLVHRLFPTGPEYHVVYPLIYRSKILIPFFWGYRILVAILKKSKRISKEIKALYRAKKTT